MKVSHKTSGSVGIESASKTGKNSPKAGVEKASSSTSTAGSAKVDVSERAQMMQKAKEIASGDSIDEAKVARLQKMIDDGQYNTDASAIADRLIDDHMNFPD